jgi:sec-independent protein translocase protein TatA
MFANFGPGHWAVLAVVMIMLFGAKRLPDTARSLGKSLRIIKSELGELHDDVKADTPEAAPTSVPSERVDAAAPSRSTPTPARCWPGADTHRIALQHR